jgi:hypothetical protein
MIKVVNLPLLFMISAISASNGPLCQSTHRGGADRLPNNLPFDPYVSLKVPISSLPGFYDPRKSTLNVTRCPVFNPFLELLTSIQQLLKKKI